MNLKKLTEVPSRPEARTEATGQEGSRLFSAGSHALLWFACILYFWPVLLGGESFYFRDTMAYYYPEAVITAGAWSSGELALWEPGISLGYPYHADPHSLVFYPLSILLVLLPFPLAYNAMTVIHVPLMGSFMFALHRRWGLRRSSAIVGAAALMFCGFSISSTSLTTLLRGLCWIPLALLAFDRFLTHGSVAAIGATALVLAVSGSGTDPNYVLYAGILLGISPWMRPGGRTVSAVKALAGVVASGALALALLTFQYLPLAQLVSISTRMSVSTEEKVLYDVNPVNLYNLFLPVPFPDGQSPFLFVSYWNGELPFYPDLYWGFPMLLLVLAALGWLWSCSGTDGVDTPEGISAETARLPVLILSGLAGFSLLVAMGKHVGAFELLTTVLPPLGAFRFPAKYMLLTAFSVSALAGFGFEGLGRSHGPSLRIYECAMIPSAVTLLLLLAAVSRPESGFFEQFLRDGGAAMTSEGRDEIQRTFQSTWSANLAMALATLLLLGGIRYLSRRGLAGFREAALMIGLVSILDLTASTRPSVVSAADELVYRPPGTTSSLLAATGATPPFRYVQYPPNQVRFGFNQTAFDYYLLEGEMQVGLRGSIQGLSSLLALLSVRTADQNALSWLFMAASGRPERDRLAAACGASAVVSPEGMGNVPGLTQELQRVGPVVVRRLPSPCPRIFIAPMAVAASEGETLPSTGVLLQLPDVAVFEASDATGRAPLQPREIRRCDVIRYGRNGLAVEVEVVGEGLLVVLDSMYPGWIARVDGVERTMSKVAGLFRGVEVRDGDTRVEMRYEPASLRIGGIISLSTLALLLLFWSYQLLPCKRQA